MYPGYNEKQLLDNIRKFYAKHGRVPTKKELHNPTEGAYRRVFGTWTEALIRAGFEPMNIPYTKDELLNALKNFHEKHGRVPRERDTLNFSELPSSHTYKRYFGSWNKAIELAGYSHVLKGRRLKEKYKHCSFPIHKRFVAFISFVLYRIQKKLNIYCEGEN